MRRTLVLLILLTTAWTAVPLASALAQGRGRGGGGGGGGGDDEQKEAQKKKRDAEWELRQAPLPGKRNAGACPFVKVLYDAARYQEFKDGKEASGAVAYSGEIDGINANYEYRGVDPIRVKMEIGFGLGRGPEAAENHKTYRYWVAVTHRNREVLAKEYYNLPVSFPSGQDRVKVTDQVGGIEIPRANSTVSGENFEILVGFDVTPEMADFNRNGKRFRINAGAPAPSAAAGAQPSGR